MGRASGFAQGGALGAPSLWVRWAKGLTKKASSPQGTLVRIRVALLPGALKHQTHSANPLARQPSHTPCSGLWGAAATKGTLCRPIHSRWRCPPPLPAAASLPIKHLFIILTLANAKNNNFITVRVILEYICSIIRLKIHLFNY